MSPSDPPASGLVTACIVARDEAPLLPDCLGSLRGAVSDVVLVDHGSRDETAAVARELGARVIASSSPAHELARNTYLDAVRTGWVLVVDADERLSAHGRAALTGLVRGARDHVLGFALERFDYTGRGRWASTRLVRLFRAHPRIRYFASRAHASVARAIDELGGTIAPAHAPLHHLDALLERDHSAKRAGMRARLEAEIASGAHAVMRCFFALELFATGDDDGAAEQLSRALAEEPRCEPIVRLFRAQQHRVRERLELAEREARQVLALDPPYRGTRPGAFVVLADVQARRGRRDAAVATMRAALDEEPDRASHHLSLAALLERSDREAARAHLSRARDANPWLLAPAIFAEGTRPCIFRQQDALLTCVDRGDLLATRLGVSLPAA